MRECNLFMKIASAARSRSRGRQLYAIKCGVNDRRRYRAQTRVRVLISQRDFEGLDNRCIFKRLLPK